MTTDDRLPTGNEKESGISADIRQRIHHLRRCFEEPATNETDEFYRRLYLTPATELFTLVDALTARAEVAEETLRLTRADIQPIHDYIHSSKLTTDELSDQWGGNVCAWIVERLKRAEREATSCMNALIICRKSRDKLIERMKAAGLKTPQMVYPVTTGRDGE